MKIAVLCYEFFKFKLQCTCAVVTGNSWKDKRFRETHKLAIGNRLKSVSQIPSWATPVAYATTQSANPAVQINTTLIIAKTAVINLFWKLPFLQPFKFPHFTMKHNQKTTTSIEIQICLFYYFTMKHSPLFFNFFNNLLNPFIHQNSSLNILFNISLKRTFDWFSFKKRSNNSLNSIISFNEFHGLILLIQWFNPT